MIVSQWYGPVRYQSKLNLSVKVWTSLHGSGIRNHKNTQLELQQHNGRLFNRWLPDSDSAAYLLFWGGILSIDILFYDANFAWSTIQKF